jgi:zona occludens toxin
MICIHHGPAGSYKSSSVVWFELLPALRAGRVVVTNVEGMYPLHVIEKQLGEKFPETARLFRIFSQEEKLKALWRRWFHWMPLGALVIIDEVQDVYTVDKTQWKESDLDLKPLSFYSEVLPPELYKLSYETHLAFKPSIDESTSDDTGKLALDENGLVIYPPTMNEAFMRHRKFNWDLHFATPDLTQVSKAVRAVAEQAISYRNNDWFFLNKRKPRLFKHDPKRLLQPKKGDLVSTHKVPLDVHLLYKSTQTGQITKSGASVGLFSSAKVKLIFFVILPLAFGTIGVLGYQAFFSHDKARSVPAGAASVASAPVHTQKVTYSPAGSAGDHDGVSVSPARVPPPDLFMMPFEAEKMYWVGRSCKVTSSKQPVFSMPCDIVFELVMKGKRYQVHDDELAVMGYRVVSGEYCNAKLTDSEGNRKMIYCKPQEIKEEQEHQQPYQVNAGLVANNSPDTAETPSDKQTNL